MEPHLRISGCLLGLLFIGHIIALYNQEKLYKTLYVSCFFLLTFPLCPITGVHNEWLHLTWVMLLVGWTLCQDTHMGWDRAKGRAREGKAGQKGTREGWGRSEGGLIQGDAGNVGQSPVRRAEVEVMEEPSGWVKGSFVHLESGCTV